MHAIPWHSDDRNPYEHGAGQNLSSLPLLRCCCCCSSSSSPLTCPERVQPRAVTIEEEGVESEISEAFDGDVKVQGQLCRSKSQRGGG